MSEPLAERTIQGLHMALASQLPSGRPGRSVLDIGCGNGAWLERLASMGYRDLWGIDQICPVVRTEGMRFVTADLDAGLPDLGSQRFGLITAIEVVEHLANPGHLFQLVEQHLEPEGRFLMTTPNVQSVVARLRFLLKGALPQFDEKGDPTHVQPIFLAGLARILGRHGLGVERVWGYPSKGTITSRPGVALAASLLLLFLPEAVPGDVVCVLVKRALFAAPST